MPNTFILKPTFCLFLWFFSILQAGIAQEQKINFTSLSTKDGLSSNIVTAILKDRYGLMWFATEDGLNKYDGTTFTVYRHNSADTTSLQSNIITSLHEDRSGNIWVGTNGGSLSLYDRQKDCFKNLNTHLRAAGNFNIIWAIQGDYLGRLWISSSTGVSVWDTRTKKIRTFTMESFRGSGLQSKTVLCLFEDSKRRMWVGSDNGLFLYNRAKNSFFRYQHIANNPVSLAGNNIKSIVEDKNGTIWVGTTEGLSMLAPGGRDFTNYRHIEGDSKALSSSEVYSVATDSNGKLWLGTEEGLNIFDPRSKKVTRYRPDRRDIYSLSNKSVRCVYIDREGICWIGSFKGGINKYDKHLNLFNLKQSNPFDAKGLSASIVTSFAETENGDVFIGTDGGGLNLFDRRTELFRHYDIRSRKKTAPSNLSILSLEMSKDNKLWIGTYSDGLFVFDYQTGKFQQFLKSTAGGLSDNNIFCLTEDSKGNIWIGTNGLGINVYDPKTKTFSIYSKNSNFKGAIRLPSNGYIRAIEEDKAGNMWIGSHGTGIAVINPRTKSTVVYDKANSKLPSDHVNALLCDRHQNIWAGTIGGGLSLFDKKTRQFITFSEKDGLANGVVHKIVEDQQGKLWMSTNSGISSFDPKTKTFTNYSRYNGIQNSNFYSGAGLRTSRGELFFGGVDGFNYFYPGNIKTKLDVPPVLITELKVDNTLITPGEESPIEEHISIAKEINLDYKKNFSISFVALSFSTPQQYRYSYKLEGFDKDWNHVGDSKTASYTNLDPGEYVFKVRASNASGLHLGKTTAITIHVRPPFWLTIYAYIFYVLAIIGSLLYIRYMGIQKLKRKFRLEQEKNQAKQLIEQERKEAERLHELDMLKIKFLTNLSHEFRTPISLIMGPVERMLSEQKDERTGSQLAMVKRNARRLLNLVNQLLDFRKMEEQELSLHLSDGELVSFLKEVCDSFKDLSERKNIDLIFKSHLEPFYTSFDHDKVERILFNLLSNAFKFTPSGGIITLEVDKEGCMGLLADSCITIKVTDTGIGIPSDKKEKVFDRFFQQDTATSILNQGSGIGLSITKEFVKMHGGTIHVESILEQGSCFIIHLPLAPVEIALKNTDVLPVETDAEHIPEAIDSNLVADGGSDELERPSILLVEDNDDFRFYLKDNLKAFYKIYEAPNGKEGWQKALAYHPQIIVSDINMPLMDGIELCQKIKRDKRTSHIPIILLTALTAEEEQIKGLETGANDYMTKPFNFEILNAKIKNLLLLNRTLKNTYTRQFKVQAPELVIESYSDKLLNKVVLYIEENLNNPRLSVEDLSKHVGMSRGSLYHKILELTGLSPVEYIRSVKLDKAAVLLEKSDMNVAQIAYMVGFATPNYFAKSFKAKFHMLPSEFMSLKRKSAEIKVSQTD